MNRSAFLLVVLLSCVRGVPPKGLSSTYTIKQGTIVGVESTIATMKVEFDQDLYIPSTMKCLQGTCLPDWSQPCSCDYTHQSCGSVIADVNGGSLSNCSSICDPSFCDDSDGNSWVDLVPNGEPLKLEVDTDYAETNFRLLVNNSCHNYKIIAYATNGGGTMSFNFGAPATLSDPFFHMESYEWIGEFYLCAGDPWFQLGTWFFNFLAYYKSSITIIVQELPIGNLPPLAPAVPASCTVPSTYPNYTCIQQGQEIQATCPETDNVAYVDYYLRVYTCGMYLIGLHSLTPGEDLDLFASISFSDPTLEESEFYSAMYGDDKLFQYFCPPDSKPYLEIYVSVACYAGDIPYSVFFLEVPESQIEFKPLGSLDPASTGLWMSNAATLATTDESSNITQFHLCPQWVYCSDFWYGYPTDSPNPWLPTPFWLMSDNAFAPYKTRVYDQPFGEVLNNTIALFGLVQSVSPGGQIATYISTEQIKSASLVFNGVITNIHGEGVVGSYRLTEVPLQCDSHSFNPVNKIYQEKIDALTTQEIDDIRSFLYNLDAFKFQDALDSCATMLDNVVSAKVKDPSVVLTQDCVTTPDTAEYLSDPCCYTALSWLEPCYPRYQNISTETVQIDYTFTTNNCHDPLCINSYLQDYLPSAEDRYNGGSVCGVTFGPEQDIQERLVVQQCQEQGLKLTPCYSDSNCASLGVGCDLFNQVCKVPYSSQIDSFIRCLDSNLAQATKSTISLHMGFKNGTSSFSDDLRERATITGCTRPDRPGFNPDSNRYVLFNVEISYYPFCVPPTQICPTQFCQVDENPCYNYIAWNDWKLVTTSSEQCLSQSICNWDVHLCDGKNSTECQQQCVTLQNSTNFCGLCENSQECLEFSEVPVSVCEATTACILPGSSPILNTTNTTCESQAKCSVNCKPKCQSSIFAVDGTGICFASNTTNATCVDGGGSFDNTTATCYYSSNIASTCNATFQSCSDLSIFECVDCVRSEDSCRVQQAKLQCFVNSNIECQTANECQQAGVCSDAETLVDFNSHYGGCIVPREIPALDDPYSIYPRCYILLAAVPNGCYDASILDPTSCADAKGEWWTPANNEQECLDKYGCYELHPERGSSTTDRAFSPKNQSECDFVGGEWKPYFSWTPGVWYSGTQRQLSIHDRSTVPKNKWEPTLDFPAINQIVIQSLDDQSNFAIQSTSVCSQTRDSSLLTALVCDCTSTEVHTDQCYQQNDIVPVSIGLTCPGTPAELKSNWARVVASASGQQCFNAYVAEFSANRFFAPTEVTLSGNFANFKPSIPYAIYNTHGATVGSIIGNGIQVKFDGPVDTLICFELQSSFTFDPMYTVHDFAVVDDEHQQPYPLELTMNYDGSSICANLTAVSGTLGYFPIVRLAKFAERSFQRYDSTTIGLMYALGALFLVPAVMGTLKIGHLIFTWILAKSISIRIVEILIFFIWVFNIIRSVYFFVSPTVTLNNVTDYTLVVIPTFFYFTAFTIMVTFWAVMIIQGVKARGASFKKLFYGSAVLINATIYAFLIIIILVFQFVTKTPSVHCTGRVILDQDQTLQKQISLAYSIVIAIISLGLSISYLLFGFRILKQLQSKTLPKKILFMIIIGSGGFLLHCAFIIAIAALSKPNVTFSFVGLIITEIIPSIIILAIFSIDAYKSKTTELPNDTTVTSGATSSTATVSTTSSDFSLTVTESTTD